MSVEDSTTLQKLLDSLSSSKVWEQQPAVVTEPEQIQVDPTDKSASASDDINVSETPEVMSSVTVDPMHEDSNPPANSESTSTKTTSVADLLAQLKSSNTTPPPYTPSFAGLSSVYQPTGLGFSDLRSPLPSHSTSPLALDLKGLSFQQSLPIISTLSADDFFVASVTRLKWEQDALEKKLGDERKAIQTKYDEKTKAANKRAEIINTPWSKHEMDMMSDSCKRELRDFDAGRALPAWDGLVAKQQAALERLKVPAMFVTSAATDMNRQQRVIQILEGIAGGDAPER